MGRNMRAGKKKKSGGGANMQQMAQIQAMQRQMEQMQDEINQMIYPESFGPKQAKEEPDWETIHARLQSSRKVNLQYIWEEEYRPANPDGYSYSRFCAKYVEWKNATGKKVVLPQEREPGKELFIDWVGDPLSCVVDYDTGEAHDERADKLSDKCPRIVQRSLLFTRK